MLKIVPFDANRDPKSKEFGLEDLSDDTLDLSRAGVAILKTLPEGDWSNQELASIYLAVRLLKHAGVALETHRGITDDGSPWYVFCNAEGEVLVHIARIDSAYIIDGVGLDRPITGKTFDELINRFVSGAVDKTTSEKQAGVAAVFDLSKHRQNKVFIHPAAQLVALIWAAMIVKDAAAANAAEADWTPIQDEPNTSQADGPDFDTPTFSHIPRPSLPEVSDQATSGSSTKSRDGLTLGLQASGLVSLGYFLIGPEAMSPAAVLDRLKIEAGVGEDESASAVSGSISEAADVFFDVLAVLADLDLVTLDEALVALQDNAASDAGITPNSFSFDSIIIKDNMHETGLSVNQFIDFSASNTFTQVQSTAFQVPQDAPTVVTTPTPINTVNDPYTIDAFLDYLTDLVIRSLEGNEAIIADLIDLAQDSGTSSAGGSLESGTVTGDREVIAAMIELFNSAKRPVKVYQDDGMHIIDYRGSEYEGASDTISLSWTFSDGSQVMIIGASVDLHHLDMLI